MSRITSHRIIRILLFVVTWAVTACKPQRENAETEVVPAVLHRIKTLNEFEKFILDSGASIPDRTTWQSIDRTAFYNAINAQRIRLETAIDARFLEASKGGDSISVEFSVTTVLGIPVVQSFYHYKCSLGTINLKGQHIPVLFCEGRAAPGVEASFPLAKEEWVRGLESGGGSLGGFLECEVTCFKYEGNIELHIRPGGKNERTMILE